MELNLATAHEHLANAFGDRPCLIWRGRTRTFAEVTDRTRRLANLLLSHGITRHGELADCAAWESPHDHVGLYLLNDPVYLEGMLGAAKAGAAAFNINYRYVADELVHVLDDAGTAALLYHGRFASTLAEVLPRLRVRPRLLLRVDDGTGDDLLPGALDFETALATADPAPPDATWLPDDLYIVYTGGTTGAPKGVLWRQADFLVSALGIRRPDGTDHESLDELVDAARDRELRAMPAPPLMHGAAHWNAISAWLGGGTVVMQDITDRLDPVDVLDVCENHAVTSLLIVGDAFGRPLLDELIARPRDLSSLRFLLTGGAILSPALRRGFLDALPDLRIVDVLGSSESGRQAVARVDAARDAGFTPASTTEILSPDRDRVLDRTDSAIGWLAQGGRIPRGYLGDPAKTDATFPLVAGRRWSVPGDRAAWGPDGRIILHGRDSVTINTGGEKVFAEEVEAALKAHPAVYDVLVVGRPSERWGSEIVAVVAPRGDERPGLEELRETAATALARYKLPKDLVLVDRVERSPSGKPDYAWARSIAADPPPAEPA